MIRIVIQAGFGNQLFQYAAGYALAKRLGQPFELDISFFDYARKLNTDNLRVNNLDKLSLDNPRFINQPTRYWRYRYGVLLRKWSLDWILAHPYKVIWENVPRCREYQADLFANASRNKNFAIYGFWQNTNYFNDITVDLRRQFRPNYDLSPEVLKFQNEISGNDQAVGVHIRRGDFVRLGWNKDADYYTAAMDIMSKRLPSPHFYIITDDKLWCIGRFGNKTDTTIVDIKTSNQDIDEFFLLSLCSHQIISESTFGWWAAYLNDHKDRIVIVPKEAKGEIFDQGWIKL